MKAPRKTGEDLLGLLGNFDVYLRESVSLCRELERETGEEDRDYWKAVTVTIFLK